MLVSVNWGDPRRSVCVRVRAMLEPSKLDVGRTLVRAGTGVVLRARLAAASDASFEVAGRFAFEAGAGGVCARGAEPVSYTHLTLPTILLV